MDAKSRFRIFIVAFGALGGLCQPVQEHCYALRKMVSRLRHPITVLPLPTSDTHVLVGEHRGIILTLSLAQPNANHRRVVLNITDRVLTSNEPADERGLLSFALDPRFPSRRSIFVCYSAPSNDSSVDHETKISRFSLSDGDGDSIQALSHSEEVLLRVAQPGQRYNGGQLLFGPDRLLYISTGDGGAENRSHRFDLGSLLGKVLRIDVSEGPGYRIPAGNPFVGHGSAVRSEIFAYGFRNPWRCAVYRADTEGPRADGVSLLCGDTGVEPDRLEEEVFLVQSGYRYGWTDLNRAPCLTHDACAGAGPNGTVKDDLPVFRYTREQGQAIVGGIVYRGNALDATLRGKFIYADFVHGSLHALLPGTPGQRSWSSEDICLKPCDKSEDAFSSFYVLGIATDSVGEPLIMTTTDLRNDAPAGVIYRLETPHCNSTWKDPGSNSAHLGPGDTLTVVCLWFLAFSSLLLGGTTDLIR